MQKKHEYKVQKKTPSVKELLEELNTAQRIYEKHMKRIEDMHENPLRFAAPPAAALSVMECITQLIEAGHQPYADVTPATVNDNAPIQKMYWKARTYLSRKENKNG